MNTNSALEEFLALLHDALGRETLVKVTLGAYRGGDATLKNVFVRPVSLRAGPRLSFLYRHAARDLTRNYGYEEGLSHVAQLLKAEFGSAHLFTTEQSAQLERREGRAPRLTLGKAAHSGPPSARHDRARRQWVDPRSPWLHALGVTTSEGSVREAMAPKFRQISRFVETLDRLMAGTFPAKPSGLRVADMGSGKGYLTFALYAYLRSTGWQGVEVLGVEATVGLVETCNRVAQENGFDRLRFEADTIQGRALPAADVLMALHACDTATDDAIAKGIRAGAALIIVAPCCHKELRAQLRAPPVLAGALRHGILRERQAEFATDALRAGLLEWAGYETRVFEFIGADHTAKNLMIAAVKRPQAGDPAAYAQRVRDLAGFYGIKQQRLTELLGFDLVT